MEFKLRDESLQFIMDLFELAIAKFVNFGLMGGLVLHLEHEDDFVIEVGLVTYDLGLQRLHTLDRKSVV